MEHNWEDYFDTSSEYWLKAQKIYEENEHFPKIVVKNRNLHHKFPRSFSKKNNVDIDNDENNLVSLSLANHFLIHYYLWKCCKKGYRGMMALAFQFMRKKAIKYASDDTIEKLAKDYENIMKDASEQTSITNKGKCFSEKTKKKMSEAHKGKTLSEEWKRKISKVKKGKKRGHLSEETKEKMSKIKKGKHWKLVDGKRVWY